MASSALVTCPAEGVRGFGRFAFVCVWGCPGLRSRFVTPRGFREGSALERARELRRDARRDPAVGAKETGRGARRRAPPRRAFRARVSLQKRDAARRGARRARADQRVARRGVRRRGAAPASTAGVSGASRAGPLDRRERRRRRGPSFPSFFLTSSLESLLSSLVLLFLGDRRVRVESPPTSSHSSPLVSSSLEDTDTSETAEPG